MEEVVEVEETVKPKKKHIARRVIIIVVIVVVVLCAAGIGIGTYFCYYALSPSSSSAERNVEGATNYQFPAQDQENEIRKEYSETTSPVYITSEDGLKLHAELTRNEDSHIWALCIHGYKGNCYYMMEYGARYAERGYNVLLPDNRAQGESEGNWIGMGWLDRSDIELWIDWIIEQDPEAEIFLHGVSMGGATTLMVSGDNPSHVIGYIDDCGYTSVWDIFESELQKRFGLPAFPVLDLASMMSNILAGYGFKEASAIEQVVKCENPILFIHGTDDDFVPVEMAYENYRAAQCEKEIYIVEGAGHAQSEVADPDTYWETVFDFLDNVLLVDETALEDAAA